MGRKYPKVVENFYAVLVNDKHLKDFETLANARKFVKSMQITEQIKEVKIIKQCTTHTTVDILKPEFKATLSFADFDWTGDEPT